MLETLHQDNSNYRRGRDSPRSKPADPHRFFRLPPGAAGGFSTTPSRGQEQIQRLPIMYNRHGMPCLYIITVQNQNTVDMIRHNYKPFPAVPILSLLFLYFITV